MAKILEALQHELQRHKALSEEAFDSLTDDQFFQRPSPHTNSIAIVVKHLAGSIRSRWTDFLTTDGEKPDRDRDNEFALTETEDRQGLMAQWHTAWEALLTTVAQLTEEDLPKTVTIRGEPHSVTQALLRGTTHIAYHTGQILYLARWLEPSTPWLTIPPGQSKAHRPGYLTPRQNQKKE